MESVNEGKVEGNIACANKGTHGGGGKDPWEICCKWFIKERVRGHRDMEREKMEAKAYISKVLYKIL
jgi:hypothetical protein